MIGKNILLALTAVFLCSCTPVSYDYFSSLRGTVTDSETHETIAGVNVMLSPGGKSKLTGTDGTFEFDSLEPQQYTVTVQKSGYATNRKTVKAIAGETIEFSIAMDKQ